MHSSQNGNNSPPIIRVLDERNEEQIDGNSTKATSSSSSTAGDSMQNGHKNGETEENDNKLTSSGHKKLDKISLSSPAAFSRPNSEQNSIRSTSNKAKFLKERASELIVRIPARQLKRIAETQGIGSLQRETQHFVGVTSVNGLLRIYRSRGFFRICWITVTAVSLLLLFWQITNTIQLYFSKPTVSQVSFLLPGNGLPFPAVTICSHNPIRREYVESMNRTNLISQKLLEYIMLSFMDAQYLLSSVTMPEALEAADQEWKSLTRLAGPNFSVNGFFWNASQTCRQMLKVCSFGGKQFDCCAYAKGILTDIGKCYQLDLSGTDKPWLRRQVQAGMNNGLQIIVDAHTEQQISSLALGATGRPFADNFETGFRYYVHEQRSMPYLSTEGISVSPGTKVYSAISPTNYILLPKEMWGNCSDHWPDDLLDIVQDGAAEEEKYSSVNCKTLCHAKYFNDLCGCSPFIYNIEEYYSVCTPYETYLCLNSTVLNGTSWDKHDWVNLSTDVFHQLVPACPECKIECQRWVYHTYNSYAQGFSPNSLNWLRRENAEWSPGHVRSNFVSINIFYRDMVYTEYKQVQSISKTQILSDIGGNMGLFLGMSVISLIEFFTFICKITWLFISKKRRQHMLAKKRRDEERERHLQATLEMATQQQKYLMSSTLCHRHHHCSTADYHNSEGTFGMIRRLAHKSMRRKCARVGPAVFNVVSEHHYQQKPKFGRRISAPKMLTFDSAVPGCRKRSNSVFATLFSGKQSTASDPITKRHDLVESIIENRLHGDAARATRRSSSLSLSSLETSYEEGGIGAVPEQNGVVEPQQERKDNVVELKIDLNANTVKLLRPAGADACGRHRRRYSTAIIDPSRRASIIAMAMSPSSSRSVNRSLSHNNNNPVPRY